MKKNEYISNINSSPYIDIKQKIYNSLTQNRNNQIINNNQKNIYFNNNSNKMKNGKINLENRKEKIENNNLNVEEKIINMPKSLNVNTAKEILKIKSSNNEEEELLDENIDISFSMKNKNNENDNNNNDNIIDPYCIEINQSLYEFLNNNQNYYQYNEPKFIQKVIKNENKIINSKNKIKNEINSSERTIYNSNSDAEFFVDNNISIKSFNKTKNKGRKIKNKVNITFSKGKNHKSKINYNKTNNIFFNVKEYKIKHNSIKNNNNICVHKIQQINKKDNLKNITKDKMEINEYNKKYINKNNEKHNNSYKNIYKTNNNNSLLISTFLSNKNNSRNKINNFYSNNKINKSFNLNKKDKENINNNIHRNFSFKNVINDNIILKQKNDNIKNEEKSKSVPYKNNNKKKKIQQNKNNNNNIKINTINSDNYSYIYNNFYIYNEPNNSLYEKNKMKELIEKIPNNELKNEIMILFQRIINYNKEIIINKNNKDCNYIITFSNNYIKINDNNKYREKKFDQNQLYIKNEINFFLIRNSHNNTRNYIHNNIILNNITDESFFKQYTFQQKKKIKKIKEINNKDFDTNIDINRKLNSSNILTNFNNKNENNKIELIAVNKTYKKIMNLNDIIINSNKMIDNDDISKNNNFSKNSRKRIKRHNSMKYKINQKSYDNIKKTKSSISTDLLNNKKNRKISYKLDEYYSISSNNEKILFEKNMNKLIKINDLLKNIKNSKNNNNNKNIKEDNLVMFSVICLLTEYYFMIFKNKEKINPLFKKNLKSLKEILILKRASKYILIIKFSDFNNNESKKKESNEKEQNIGLLIDKENYYNEFIKILKQLINDLNIIYLN